MIARDAALKIGTRIARKVFEKRGNHSEAHLSEAELAALLTVAAEAAYQEAWMSDIKGKIPDWIVAGLVRTIDPVTGQVWWVKP